MKTRRGVFHFLFTTLCIAVIAAPVLADWQEGGPHKMHYPQLPDTNGWDVIVAQEFMTLADDFMCTEDGPITNVHFWVSWYNDEIGTITNIHLSIHADMPMPNPAGYSYPIEPPLWTIDLASGFNVVQYGDGVQGWYEVPSSFELANHTNIYQVNVTDLGQDPFVQVSGTVYWLDIRIAAQNGWIGWKTSVTNWNDDAVYWTGQGPFFWGELTNPVSPQKESLDLAFVIDGGKDKPEDSDLCAKWSQPPDCDIGVDVESWAIWNDGAVFPGPFKVADDWLCDGRPIVGVRWWGSYIGWETNNADPTIPPPGNRPMGFNITWYTDIPATMTEFSRPGDVLATNYYPLEQYMNPTNYIYAQGVVYETTSCVSHFAFYDPNLYEHEYDYWLEFPAEEIWNEKDGEIYWLSIEAVYLNTTLPTSNFWGWKTTPPQWNWNDDAVLVDGGATNDLIYPPPKWGFLTNHPYEGLSVNMAYELLTDVCPSRCKKWEQPPDMLLGQDMQSWRTNSTGILRADDFVSDGRPITDIHWWGSYLNWKQTTPGSVTSPVPYPTNSLERPLGFKLSWHAHDPINCVPTNAITNVFVAITNCHEVYYGSVTQEWLGPDNYEHEYQYYVDLLHPSINAPWYETNGVRYWLDIQAVFPQSFDPESARHDGWGWKITPEVNNFGCFSKFSGDGGVSWRGDTVQTDGGASHPRATQNFDLSFELTTTEIPWYTNAVVAGFTNMAHAPVAGNLYLWSTGHCGCGKQVLQESTNLTQGGVGAGWVDVWTNPQPTAENLWWGASVSTTRFYRIKQVP